MAGDGIGVELRSEPRERSFSYAREEAGGPLEKGRRKLGATSAGEAYVNTGFAPAIEGETSSGALVTRSTGALPALQSPRQLH